MKEFELLNGRRPYPLNVMLRIHCSSANEDDITVADKVLHGDEERVWGDAGYVGIEKREEHKNRDVQWLIAKRPGKLKTLAKEQKRWVANLEQPCKRVN